MTDTQIALRVKDCFLRQIGWFEALLTDLATLDGHPDGPDADFFALRLDEHLNTTRALAREFEVLTGEWRATDEPTDADRREMRALARRAEALAAELKQRYDRADRRVQARLAELTEVWNSLQRGRDMLKKYAPGQPADASFVDKRV